jgi:hypothetical protein
MPTQSCAPVRAHATTPSAEEISAARVDVAYAAVDDALEALRAEYRRQHLEMLQERDAARARADKLSQLLVGASSLADCVVRGKHTDARELAAILVAEIERLPR